MRVVTGSEARPLNALSGRELLVLSLMAQGRSNTSIARELCVAPKTVETHVRAIYGKLGLPPESELHRRVAAVLIFMADGDRQRLRAVPAA